MYKCQRLCNFLKVRNLVFEVKQDQSKLKRCYLDLILVFFYSEENKQKETETESKTILLYEDKTLNLIFQIKIDWRKNHKIFH